MASSNSYESQGQPRPLQMGAKGAYIVRLLMVGDSSCGKTSLVLRFDQNVFSTKFVTTIGVDYRDKMVKVRRFSCFRLGQNGAREFSLTISFFGYYPRLKMLPCDCNCGIQQDKNDFGHSLPTFSDERMALFSRMIFRTDPRLIT